MIVAESGVRKCQTKEEEGHNWHYMESWRVYVCTECGGTTDRSPVATVDQLKAYMKDRYDISGADTLYLLDELVKKPGFTRPGGED